MEGLREEWRAEDVPLLLKSSSVSTVPSNKVSPDQRTPVFLLFSSVPQTVGGFAILGPEER